MFTCTAIVSFFAFLTRFLETPITIMYEPSATSRMAVLRSFHPSLPSSYPPSSNFWPFAFLFHYKSTRLFSWPSQPLTPFPPSFLHPLYATPSCPVFIYLEKGVENRRERCRRCFIRDGRHTRPPAPPHPPSSYVDLDPSSNPLPALSLSLSFSRPPFNVSTEKLKLSAE